MNNNRYLPMSLVAAPLILAATASLIAQNLIQEPDKFAKQISNAAANANAAEFTKLFADPDPSVRTALYIWLMDIPFIDEAKSGQKRWLDGPLLMKFVAAAETDPNEKARAQANNMLKAISNCDVRKPPFVDDLVEQIVKQGSSKDANTRRISIRTLGLMKTRDESSIDLYAVAVKDNDPKVCLATIQAIGRTMDSLQGNESETRRKLKAILASAFTETKDSEIREHASLAIYFTRSEIPPALAESKDENDRVLAAIFRSREKNPFPYTPATRPDEPTRALTDEQKLIVQALHHPWFWVRAVARIWMPLKTPGLQSGTALLEAIDDPNPDVARDAALYLSGYLQGFGNVSYEGALARMTDYHAPGIGPLQGTIADAVLLTSAGDTAKRLEGLQKLAEMGGKSKDAMPALVSMFADRDAKVASAARKAAVNILTDLHRPAHRSATTAPKKAAP